MRRVLCLILVAGLLPAISVVQAQEDPSELALKYSKSQEENKKLQTQYTWSRRVEVKEGGNTEEQDLYTVRYDLDGKIQVTRTGGKEQERAKRGLRGRRQKKDSAKTSELTQSVDQLAKKYLQASTGQLVDFFKGATVSAGSGDKEGIVEIKGKGLVQAGDSVTLWMVSEGNRPYRMEFNTVLGKDAVEGVVEYQTNKDGLFYAARTTIEIPKKKVEYVFEIFDMKRVKS